jgi:putative ABC transport system permease protein
VAGTALSPEFIQQMRPGSAFPDSKRYGVMWMERRALGQAYDLEGAFNDLAIGLAPGASAAAVMAAVDGLLERYGGLGAYARHDQRSHRFLSEELQQLGTLARLFPAMFLAVAAYLLNVVIGRLVTMQREQVATLKAFGYGNGAILAHYLKLVAAIAAAGIVAGVGLGHWLGGLLAGLYMDFYHFPWLRYTLEPLVVVQAAAVSLLAACAGAWAAVARWRACSRPRRCAPSRRRATARRCPSGSA